MVPDESRLSAGSWLVVPDRPYRAQAIDLPAEARPEFLWDVSTPWRLHTLPAYYGTNKAVERRDGPAVRLYVYRLTTAVVPKSPP